MSIVHTTAALEIRSLEPTSKLLLLVLCLGADRQGRGEATTTELANQTGLAERTIRTHMANLVIGGFVKKQRYEFRYELTRQFLPHVAVAG